MNVTAWILQSPKEPLVRESREENCDPGDVLVEVAGCGVCHTDLGFYEGGVPTRHPLPLTLGHEISGRVVEAGAEVEQWLGKDVIVPAVIPCGDCAACNAGRGAICPQQIFPGNDIHGGFATHVRVPANGLCPVPELGDATQNPGGIELATLAVIADAVTTPYQAILRSELSEGDLAVFVGVGGVGGFGVQIAACMGAEVIAIDVEAQRLARIGEYGASLTLSAGDLDFRALRKQVREFAAARGIPTWRRKIFETSGTVAGQATAFGLVDSGGYLSVIGYTPERVEVRLSNLMALDATVQGNWGCHPEHYPGVLDMVLSGRVQLSPFVERRPLSSINETFVGLCEHHASRRVVLIPEP